MEVTGGRLFVARFLFFFASHCTQQWDYTMHQLLIYRMPLDPDSVGLASLFVPG